MGPRHQRLPAVPVAHHPGGRRGHLRLAPVLDPSRRFIFFVGSTPIRFLKGDPTKSQSKTVVSALAEWKFREMELELGDERHALSGRGWVWRLVVVPDEAGGVLEIVLCQMKAGHRPRYLYPIAIGPVARVASATAMQSDAKDLGKPQVGLPEDDEAATAEASGDGA